MTTMRHLPPTRPGLTTPGHQQRGAIVMPMIAAVLVLGASTLALQAAKQTQRPLEEQRTTEHRLDRIEQALNAHALKNGCTTLPAMPAPEVPWRALGLQADDRLDAWGRLFTYRQAAAGLTVSGVPVRWVVVSHGPSGLGARLPSGSQMPLPAVGNLAETANAQSPTNLIQLPFFAPPDIEPSTDINHFDDIVRFASVAEFNALCAGAPPPPPPPVAANAPSVTLNQTTLATSGVTFSGFASGQQTLTIPASGTAPGLTVAVQAGQQIATDNTGNPKVGLGVCSSSGPCNPTNAELSGVETLSFKLVNATAYKLGLLLKNFTLAEAVQITFKLGGTQVGAVVNHSGAANASNLVPTIASAAFDEVVIGAGASSSFFINAVRFCDASTPCVP